MLGKKQKVFEPTVKVLRTTQDTVEVKDGSTGKGISYNVTLTRYRAPESRVTLHTSRTPMSSVYMLAGDDASLSTEGCEALARELLAITQRGDG